MISLFTLMLLGNLDVAEAHPGHIRHRNSYRSVHTRHVRATPAPSARRGYDFSYQGSHRIYRHNHSDYVWQWTFGYYDLKNIWVPGHWSMTVRF